jgi:methionyl-tRNA synthetase
MSKKFYITTAIAYVNGPPHMGHALEFIQADAIARFRRLAGHDVHFVTGADEHGVKLLRTAQSLGVSPEALVETNTAAYQSLNRLLQISHDDYIRTVDRARHWPAVRKLWRRMAERGDIYKQYYEALYCSGCEKFLTERDVADGRCPLHPTVELEPIHEENYFFRLSRYGEEIGRRIASDELRIIPETRRNEILSLIREGLKDVSFSRSRKALSWGIPVPDDPEQTIYVWGDALTNYLSAVGYAEETDLFRKHWPADLHCIGKDIIRFHTAIWPGMLLSAGLPLPRGVFVHGFVNDASGQRMSKSSGNVVDPVEVAQRYGADSLRYYLLREIPTVEDGNFSMARFVERHNADLANDLGNLVNRTVVMAHRYAGGEVPDARPDAPLLSDLRQKALETVARVERAAESLDLNGAVEAVWGLVREANRFIEVHAPWALARDPARRKDLDAVLYGLIETLRYLSVLLAPIAPGKAGEVWTQIGQGGDPGQQGFEALRAWGGVRAGTRLGEAKVLFPRIEAEEKFEVRSSKFEVQSPKSKVKTQTQESGAMTEAETGLIDIAEFQRVRLRVASVVAAERVAGADKLLKLQIDLGDERRQIVAGIAQHYAPEALVGKQIVVVANLRPARIRGIDSQGMLLAAHGGDGLKVVTVDGAVEQGSKVS